MAIKFTDLAYVGHPVTDVPRARAFYEQTLELKAVHVAEVAPGQWWIEYAFPGGTLAISNTWPPGGSGVTTALETEDLHAAFAHCEAAGATIAFAIMDTPVCRFFGLKDPDGNDLVIHQRKAVSDP
jgi:predicted enzyme related to lactoylglutathione lyase